MGKKKGSVVIRSVARRAEAADPEEDPMEEGFEDPLDAEAAAEEAALQELERERAAEQAELDAAGGGGGGGGDTAGSYNKLALEALAAELTQPELPWLERLDLVALEALQVPDAHDDLARELAFYEQSLAAVKAGRERLKSMNIPWKRPDDFFCEMLKSDSHMARVKDKLIFEQKKMDAFEQRKERQTQRKFAKAVKDQKMREKSQFKKESLAQVEQWRKENKTRRRDGLLEDDDGLEGMLQDRPASRSAPSRKRQNADKKYGWGGQKNKKATRNDSRSLNDDRDFVPKPKRARVDGGGGGRGGGGSRGGGGKRPGKQARAQNRLKNRSS